MIGNGRGGAGSFDSFIVFGRELVSIFVVPPLSIVGFGELFFIFRQLGLNVGGRLSFLVGEIDWQQLVKRLVAHLFENLDFVWLKSSIIALLRRTPNRTSWFLWRSSGSSGRCRFGRRSWCCRLWRFFGRGRPNQSCNFGIACLRQIVSGSSATCESCHAIGVACHILFGWVFEGFAGHEGVGHVIQNTHTFQHIEREFFVCLSVCDCSCYGLLSLFCYVAYQKFCSWMFDPRIMEGYLLLC